MKTRRIALCAALAGAIALPPIMTASLYAFMRLSRITVVSIDISQVWPNLAFKYGFIGAGIGLLSAILWSGTRRAGWRLLGALYGLGITAYSLWLIWTTLDSRSIYRMYTAMFTAASNTPVILCGLTLAFFALVTRSTRRTAPLYRE